MTSVVFIRRVPSYGSPALFQAVTEIFSASGLSSLTGKILLKPNMLLGKNRHLAVTTHTAVAEAVLSVLQPSADRLLIGDSPGLPLPPSVIAGQLGYMDLIRKTGSVFADFEKNPVTVRREENLLVKTFVLARPAVEADFLINLPKMKTHVGSIFSGAVKNLFGCVPGLLKAQFHFRFPDREHFGRMLADCAATMEADFHLMDAVVAMEGEGPSNGRPVPQGLILASRDPVALDATACSIAGIPPASVPHLVAAEKAGLGTMNPEAISLDGISRIEEVRIRTYDVRASHKEMRFGPAGSAQRMIRFLATARPVIRSRDCAACQLCVKICPAAAMTAGKGEIPSFNYDKCIRCYCCHEICPEGAIVKKETLISRLLG